MQAHVRSHLSPFRTPLQRASWFLGILQRVSPQIRRVSAVYIRVDNLSIR